LTKLIAKKFDLADPVVAGILDAATAEFAQYGLGGARLERIIANTHTSKRMVYYHFGSKEGLYQAVLEHVFTDARFREENFDLNLGTAHQALEKFVINVFDAFSDRPDFARLLTFENLSGAVHIQGSALISKLNQRSLSYVEHILKRGQSEGSMRLDILAIDLYMSIVGLCYYQVANRAGYVAGGFKALSSKNFSVEKFQMQRKRAVVETAARYAMAI
jgi:AcrR family transcriptional regulator